jgi:hypothetical protein
MNDSGNPQPWWYNAEGKQLGPVSGDELIGLIKSRGITAQTGVWQEGQDTWKPASQTALAQLIEAHGPALPPPMPKGPPPVPVEPSAIEKVWHDIQGRDRFAWSVLLVLTVSIAIEYLTGWTLISIGLAIVGNITCLVMDARRLKQLGLPHPGELWCFIVPVYLWKRGGLLKDMRLYLAAWVLLFCGNIYMSYVTLERQTMIESTKLAVEEIINRNNYLAIAGNGPLWKVKALKILRKEGPGEYSAIAYTSDNSIFDVSIQDVGDDYMVSVKPRR